MRYAPGGSSPLARGTLRLMQTRQSRRRLIPARAGNTLRQRYWQAEGTAHPRSRGEHNLSGAHGHPPFGSSPLARGTLFCVPSNGWLVRLIPARAGNTVLCSFEWLVSSAHPRSRGEHHHTSGSHLGPVGSSPLARGTLTEHEDEVRARRLIPARAGNTKSRGLWLRGRAAHPRSRGEHRVNIRSWCDSYGSSPLARGTHTPLLGDWLTARLIPARAGNTLTRGSRLPAAPAHPRSRGEHNFTALALLMRNGSSPLARGTLSPRARGIEIIRLIPARAGNTQYGGAAKA